MKNSCIAALGYSYLGEQVTNSNPNFNQNTNEGKNGHHLRQQTQTQTQSQAGTGTGIRYSQDMRVQAGTCTDMYTNKTCADVDPRSIRESNKGVDISKGNVQGKKQEKKNKEQLPLPTSFPLPLPLPLPVPSLGVCIREGKELGRRNGTFLFYA